MRAVALSAGLLGVAGLAAIYWRNRGTGAAGDTLEDIATNVRRLADPPTEQPKSASGIAIETLRDAVVPTPKLPSGTRGIRNNNPGNIRRSADRWKGLRSEQTDSEFFQFITPDFGVRALGKLLQTYRRKYGLETVRDIVNRWAPPVGRNSRGETYTQDSSAYVAAVARRLNVRPDDRIDVDARLGELAVAIIIHENGRNPYSVADINQWVRMP